MSESIREAATAAIAQPKGIAIYGVRPHAAGRHAYSARGYNGLRTSAVRETHLAYPAHLADPAGVGKMEGFILTIEKDGLGFGFITGYKVAGRDPRITSVSLSKSANGRDRWIIERLVRYTFGNGGGPVLAPGQCWSAIDGPHATTDHFHIDTSKES